MVNAVMQQKVPKLNNLGAFLNLFVPISNYAKKSPSLLKDFTFYNFENQKNTLLTALMSLSLSTPSEEAPFGVTR